MFRHTAPCALAVLVAVLLVPCLSTDAQERDDFAVGGPLAGVELPLYETHHGEPPGYPGCLRKPDGSFIHPLDNQQPEFQLYPGAVEHWRTYWQHYMPIRSFFDVQSQVKRWTAPNLPGADEAMVEQYAEPVYYVARYPAPLDTGKRNDPVRVVRCKVKAPVFELDFGELTEGLYCVRIVGAVEKERLKPVRLPAFVGMRVNDGPQGETNDYRIRIGYVDDFYSIAELYFYAPAERAYRAELWLDEGSQVDLLVHDILLDDALAGTKRAVIKQRGLSMHTEDDLGKLHNWHTQTYWNRRSPAEREAFRTGTALNAEERLARDALIWKTLPHPNAQMAFTKLAMTDGGQPGEGVRYTYGVGGKPIEAIQAEHGEWTAPKGSGLDNPEQMNVLLVNEKLGLRYTWDDLHAGRPLPDPYPYKDDGCGIVTPDPEDPKRCQVFWPIANALNGGNPYNGYARQHLGIMRQGAHMWHVNRDAHHGRDAAMALIRFAYAFPTIDVNRSLHAKAFENMMRNRAQCRRRVTINYVYGSFIRFHEPLVYYDLLFDYIKGNEDLAMSVGRFVPWVETSDDVLKLLDVFLLQTTAKRMLRYNYFGDGRQPWFMADVAMCAANNDFSRPWMEWLFTKTFLYPQPIAGIADYMITGTDRDGRSPIASYSYMIGEFSADLGAAQLQKYVELGGLPRYDLRDAARFPKTMTSLHFYARSRTAGIHFPRIGDVTGPDKYYEKGFDVTFSRAALGWEWTQQPKFAWILKHYADRKQYTDAEWADIDTAAATIDRAPWLKNRSRILPGWGAFLEGGVAHDDPRFRRSVMLRIGHGAGHGHHDGLDMQIHALGLPMTVDAGQRGGYSDPGDKNTHVHNTVEVDGSQWLGHSWAQSMTDVDGARTMTVQAAHNHAKLFRRQVALVDVAEGAGSQPVPPAQQAGPKDLPKDVTLPTAYVVDVVRVDGGNQHRYCFHGNVNDPTGPRPVSNAQMVALDTAGDDLANAAQHIRGLHNDKLVGTAPEHLAVTFPLLKTRSDSAKNNYGTEALYARDYFDPGSPDKFLRWHVLGERGATVMQGDLHCRTRNYHIPLSYVQKRGEGLSSAFAAVVEPYAAEPFIESVERLTIPGNETDALAAVAVAVKTTNGHNDLIVADGRPTTIRSIRNLKVAGEFAIVSHDADGLRLAQLSGGTLLETPGLRLEVSRRELTGAVTGVDYGARQVTIDTAWPDTTRERIVEIGDIAGGGAGDYVTGYTATAVEAKGGGSVLTFLRSADYYRSLVKEVDATERRITCALKAPGSALNLHGLRGTFHATNGAETKRWRATVEGDGTHFRLDAPVTEDDFKTQHAFRLWEYGVGDRVRMATFAALRRTAPGVYRVEADVPVSISMAGTTFRISDDGKTWRPVDTRNAGDRKAVLLSDTLLGDDGAVYLNVQ